MSRASKFEDAVANTRAFARELQRYLSGWPVDRATVEVGTRSAIRLDGKQVQVFDFIVKLARGDRALAMSVDATLSDEEVVERVRREAVRQCVVFRQEVV